ncbi:MAG: hypothetical protein JXR13_18710 [Thalassovita sp.]
MKYAYTEKPVEGFEHLNPAYWSISSPRKDAKEVVVGAEFPMIAAHYKKVGAKVTVQGGIPETPEEVAKLKKTEVVDLLKAHGVEAPAGSVDELREQLANILFVNL